ncbi:MAG: DUF4157 domain-containing protein, partial [Silvibacterium sp.]|nr:DUF4157 domain-containing protein [Silvibacterium sp.]
GDAFEREADRVAEEVTAGSKTTPAWSLSRMSITPPLQRKCACGGSGGAEGQCEACKEKMVQRKAAGPVESGVAPPIVHQVLGSPGRPLDKATRDFFEPRFGHDFSRVRVHTDALAARSARAVGAVAYTVGEHVVFAHTQDSSHRSNSRKLLAHELAHVIQQRGSGLVLARQADPAEDAMRGALKHAAGVSRTILTPEEFRQLGCVIVAGACPQSVSGGVPSEETDKVPLNDKCRAITGFTGDPLWPTPQQCEEMKPGTLDVVNPARLQQLHSLIQEYASLVATGALRDDEVFGIDAAISEAEERLGNLGPNPHPASTDQPPAVVAGKDGAPAPAPKVLTASAVGTVIGPLSTAVRAALGAQSVRVVPPQVLVAAIFVAGLIVMGYIVNDFLLRKEASEAIEKLIGIIVNLLRALTDEAIERRIRTKKQAKEQPQPSPKKKPETTGPTTPIPRPCRFDPCEDPLPVSWPSELPHPIGPRMLVRTTALDREWEGVERGEPQRRMQEQIREARARLVPPPHPCFDDDTEPNAPYDAHHAHPMYLGGEDAEFNVCALRADRHQRGHPRLDNQAEHADEYLACGVCSTKLSQHPSGQAYVIVGEK